MPIVNVSEYAYWPYMISQLVLMGGSAFFFLLGIILFIHAYFYGRVSIWHLRLLAVNLFGICCCTNVALGVAQGLDVIHVAGSVVAGVLLWVVLLPFIFLFSGGDAEAVLWLRSDAHLVSHFKNKNNSTTNNNNFDSSSSESKHVQNLSEFNTVQGLMSSPVLAKHNNSNNDNNNKNNPYHFDGGNNNPNHHSSISFQLQSPQDSLPPLPASGYFHHHTSDQQQEMKSISNFQKSYHQHLVQNPSGTLFGSPSGIEGLKGPGAKREHFAGRPLSPQSSNNNNNTPDFHNQQQSSLSPGSTVSSASFSSAQFLASSSASGHTMTSQLAILKAKQEILEREEQERAEKEGQVASNKTNTTNNKVTIIDNDDDDELEKMVKRQLQQKRHTTSSGASEPLKKDKKKHSDLDLVLDDDDSNKDQRSSKPSSRSQSTSSQQQQQPPRVSTRQNSIDLSRDGQDSVCTEPAKDVGGHHQNNHLQERNNNNIPSLSRALLATSTSPPLSEANLSRASFAHNQTLQESTTSNNNNNNDQLLSKTERMKIYVKNFFSLMLRDIKQRSLIFGLFVIFAILTVLICNLMLFGICVMNKPQSVSTWITRKFDKKSNYCPGGLGKPCFSYPLVGATCSSIVIASHFVVANDEEIPSSVFVDLCSSSSTSSTGNGSSSSSSCTTIYGVIRSNDNIAEDRRYIGNVYIDGLVCGSEYTASATFVSGGGGGKRFVGDEFCFRALPGDVSQMTAPFDSPLQQEIVENKHEEISFLEGGDYVTKGRSSKPSKGKTLLSIGMRELLSPSFFSILGDISYDNNMRRCYRRVDEFLTETSDVLRVESRQVSGDGSSQKKCLVPLMTGVGNHDAGGYMWQGEDLILSSNKATRMSVSAFYYQYFPFLSFHQDQQQQSSSTSVVATTQAANDTRGNFSSEIQASDDEIGDETDTFHVHLIGSNNSYIVADSGHWSPLEVQARKLRRALEKVRAMKRTAVVSYHVPTYPSTRDRDSSNELTNTPNRPKQTFDAFTAVLSDFDDVITAVFEHHDHNYKRTERIHPVSGVQTIHSVSVNNNQTIASLKIHRREKGRGIVFCGDGALGASDEAEIVLERPPLKVGFSGNYVSAVRLYTNGSIHVKALASDGHLVDEFLLE